MTENSDTSHPNWSPVRGSALRSAKTCLSANRPVWTVLRQQDGRRGVAACGVGTPATSSTPSTPASPCAAGHDALSADPQVRTDPHALEGAGAAWVLLRTNIGPSLGSSRQPVSCSRDLSRSSVFVTRPPARENAHRWSSAPTRSGPTVGQRDRRNARMTAAQQFRQPSSACAVSPGVADDRHGADEQHPSQVGVTCLGNAAEPLLAARRVLSWDQP